MYEPDGPPLTCSAPAVDGAEEDGGEVVDVQPASAGRARDGYWPPQRPVELITRHFTNADAAAGETG